MKNLFKTIEFKSLQTQWYKKLTESGFEDAESSEIYLKEWHSHYFQSRHNPDSFDSQAEYFYQAEQFLNDLELMTSIWRLHAKGESYREISMKLRVTGIVCNKDKVNIIVNHLKEMMRSKSIGEPKIDTTRRTQITIGKSSSNNKNTIFSALGFQLSLFDVA